MGFKKLQLQLPTDYDWDYCKRVIQKKTGLKDFSFSIERKSLDARKKNNIHWQVSIVVSSEYLKGASYEKPEEIKIPFKKRNKKVVVVGSGPAGFFAAHVLQMAGFQVKIIERGSNVTKRSASISKLESKGIFSEQNNYAFGEGGAGTFSDGKLTSRSKHISGERKFILNEYVNAGAPEEILYMAHPHLGTDNLKIIVEDLRKKFQGNGGEILFETQLEDISLRSGKVDKIVCNSGELEADFFILATGHSAYDTYLMLIKRGVQFRTKNFALGHRIEHEQKLINTAQWGKESLPGVKAAEYRLTTKSEKGLPVFTFCMCPGGNIVQSAAFKNKSVVNGMSYHRRDGVFANSAVVVGTHPDALLGKTCSPIDILSWMDDLEEHFYSLTKSYEIPATKVQDYVTKRCSSPLPQGSYALGSQLAPLYNLVPPFISKALSEGLGDFSRKLKAFELGTLMGLENKTSSPVQAIREKNGKCSGIDNLYFAGEGSGFSGGILSSAADGIKCAMSIAGLI